MVVHLLFSDVWFVGDSYIKRLHQNVIRRGMSDNMGVGNVAHIRWIGVSGMRWNSLKNKIQYTALHNPPPRAVIVHLGSNDIELVKSHELERDMRQDLAFLHSTFPRSRIIVSAALPRLVWSRSDTPINLIERKRTHLNRCIRRFVINMIGGIFVAHDNIVHSENKQDLYLSDGVHLSDTATDMFAANFSEVLRQL